MTVVDSPDFIISRSDNGLFYWQGKGSYLNLTKKYKGFKTKGDATTAAIAHCEACDAVSAEVDEMNRLEPDLSDLTN